MKFVTKKIVIAFSLMTASFATVAKQVEINYWSFSKVLDPYIVSFEKAHPDIKVNFTQIPYGQYPQKLMAALRSPKTAPTIFVGESAVIDRFVEAGIWQPLDSFSEFKGQKDNFFPYVWDQGVNSKGQLVAMSWQASPGGFFYRRDFAKQYLGTDDPIVVAQKTGDINTLLDTIDTIDKKAGKQLYFSWGPTSLRMILQAKYKQKLVEKGELVTGQMMHDLFDLYIQFAKRNAMIFPETDEPLFKAMEQNNVFGFHTASWFLGAKLQIYRKSDSGNWGVASSPYTFIRGGTWLGISRTVKDPEQLAAARQFIGDLTTNVATSEVFVKSRGDFPSNRLVYDKVKDDTSDFLAGEAVLKPLSHGIEDSKLYFVKEESQLKNVITTVLEQILANPNEWTADKAVDAYKKEAAQALPDLKIK